MNKTWLMELILLKRQNEDGYEQFQGQFIIGKVRIKHAIDHTHNMIEYVYTMKSSKSCKEGI